MKISSSQRPIIRTENSRHNGRKCINHSIGHVKLR